ncbi:hypothetical protein MESS2_730017 [Mesorhizobium metallidurans STM 2683]|uniref:Uncharacterized protein n=1 Tax=Mesorhizobium metallidurans STM 2683 TaxID=1297569 RepID=M5F885_9HYPH|nr:hypothetical protein MESS2_730017 [Mesorhizobium metallidurans STM 2683]
MTWTVQFDDDFKTEFSKLKDDAKVEIRALVNVLKQLGPVLWQAEGRHSERLQAREHEGIAFRCCRRCVESRVRIRLPEEGDSSCRGGQVRR